MHSELTALELLMLVSRTASSTNSRIRSSEHRDCVLVTVMAATWQVELACGGSVDLHIRGEGSQNFKPQGSRVLLLVGVTLKPT